MSFSEYGICGECFEIIVMRKPGSHFWKRYNVEPRADKTNHDVFVIFETLWDAKKVKKAARAKYWELPSIEHSDYNKAWKKSINLVLDELGYKSKNGGSKN